MWNNKSLSEALSHECYGEFNASSVTIDSRNVTPGSIFIAIKGEKNDGHDYILNAIKSGACCCVIERSNAIPDGFPYIVIDSGIKALEKMALYARSRVNAKVIGVTGSVGKTTVKEMLRLAFSVHGETYATQGNLNNHYGVPLTLVNMPISTKFAIIEMGMSSAGEISSLTKLAKPDASVITNVELVHAEYFCDIEGIALAKAEIMEGMLSGASIVLNKDNAMYEILQRKAKEHRLKIVSFGFTDEADFAIKEMKIHADKVDIRARCLNDLLDYSLKVNSRHMVINSLAALTAVSALGLDCNASSEALLNFQPLHGRGFVHHFYDKEIVVIDESYNASPASTIAAIKSASERKLPGSRLILALGDMKELGDKEIDLHLSLVQHIIDNKVDVLYTAGSLSKHIISHMPDNIIALSFNNSLELANDLQNILSPGDIILIKGSLSTDMKKVLDAVINKLSITATI